VVDRARALGEVVLPQQLAEGLGCNAACDHGRVNPLARQPVGLPRSVPHHEKLASMALLDATEAQGCHAHGHQEFRPGAENGTDEWRR
jgi:hypothetical protein